MEEKKGGERDKRRGEGQKTQPVPLNRPTELASCSALTSCMHVLLPGE